MSSNQSTTSVSGNLNRRRRSSGTFSPGSNASTTATSSPGGGANNVSTGSNVSVVVRVRPENAIEQSRGGQMCVRHDGSEIEMEVGVDSGSSKFTFDRVFGANSTQLEVFEAIGKPLVETVFEGYNGTIFAYGQTSSGKTFTMNGPDITDAQLAGIIPRTVDAIFQSIAQADEDIVFTVRASYVEIYLERIRDLLDPKRQNLQIREDPKRGIYVEGMSEEYVNSVEEMMELMYLGSENRAQAATGMNEGSSRSHSVFILQLVQKNTKTGTTMVSKINLVDLAGSEMIRKTGATGARLDEAKMINKSLSALGNVINALTDGRSSHIPYRDSKLTRMLQESLGGNARTWLVINCSPSSYNASETLSTLRFGNRAKAIQNKAVVNQERSVEELEILLAKAEHAIDVQARYIEKLQGQLDGDSAQESSSSVASSDATNHDDLLRRNIELEEQVKALKEQHEQDVEELERSNTELRILSAELREKIEETEEQSKTIEKLKNGASSEHQLLQTKLEETASNNENLLYKIKELELTCSTLQTENEKLNKELDNLPSMFSGATPTSDKVSRPENEDQDLDHDDETLEPKQDEEQVPRSLTSLDQEIKEAQWGEEKGKLETELKEAKQKVSDFEAKEARYLKTIRELKKQVNDDSSSASGSSGKKSHMKALEERLGQLVAVHRQLLRKYASLELASAENHKMLALRDERIKKLEASLRTKDFNFRTQVERHAVELEELQLEHQRELHALQTELTRTKREALTSSDHRHISEVNHHRIVKPLRGGTSDSTHLYPLHRANTSNNTSTNRSTGGGGFLGWFSSSNSTNPSSRTSSKTSSTPPSSESNS